MALSWLSAAWSKIKKNKTWIFSGIGIVPLTIYLTYLQLTQSTEPKRIENSQVISAQNIHLEGNAAITNNTQTANISPGATNIQVMRDLSLKFGLTDEQIKDIVRHAVTELAQDNEKTTVPSSVIIGVLTNMGVPTREWDQQAIISTLIQKGMEYRDIVLKLKNFQSDDEEVMQLQRLAKNALETGHFEKAEQLLNSARDKDLNAIELQEVRICYRRKSAAESSVAAATAASLQANAAGYKKAAQYFGQAAELYRDVSTSASFSCKLNQGKILFNLGYEFGDIDSLYRSIDIHKSLISSSEFKLCHKLLYDIQNRIATAYTIIGEREGINDHIITAIDIYKSLLKNVTINNYPDEWISIQNNIGNAYFVIGQKEHNTKNLEKSASTYRMILNSILDKKSLSWAAACNNLGSVLLELGRRENDSKHLNEAITSFHLALNIMTRKNTPLSWAKTENNLGSALMALGERQNNKTHLKNAEHAFRRALEELTQAHYPFIWAIIQNNLGSTLRLIGEHDKDTQHFKSAIIAYQEATKIITAEQAPIFWGKIQHNIGSSYLEIAKLEHSSEDFDKATSALYNSLEVFNREQNPLYWAISQATLGEIYLIIGEYYNDNSQLEVALTHFNNALEILSQDESNFSRLCNTQRDKTLELMREKKNHHDETTRSMNEAG